MSKCSMTKIQPLLEPEPKGVFIRIIVPNKTIVSSGTTQQLLYITLIQSTNLYDEHVQLTSMTF